MISDLDLPPKAKNALRRWRPDVTLVELATVARGELACVPHIGQGTLEQLHTCLTEMGYPPTWSPERPARPKRERTLSPRAEALKKIHVTLTKTRGGRWHVEHGATTDGLSRVDDGTESGMHPMYGEAHEAELAALCVNFVREHVLGEDLD